jgi:hypothetical protein
MHIENKLQNICWIFIVKTETVIKSGELFLYAKCETETAVQNKRYTETSWNNTTFDINSFNRLEDMINYLITRICCD